MSVIRPIREVIINGFTINSKTTWDDIRKHSPDWSPLWRAMVLYENNAYPVYFKKELERYEGEQDVTIIVSNHRKYLKELKENPEWFYKT